VLTVLDQNCDRFWSIQRKQILLSDFQFGETLHELRVAVAENPIDHSPNVRRSPKRQPRGAIKAKGRGPGAQSQGHGSPDVIQKPGSEARNKSFVAARSQNR
jgi:hypothetical protein